MASHAKAYPNSDASARKKTGDAQVAFYASRLLQRLRRRIAESMIEVHRISPELAVYHVFRMSYSELCFRERMYAAMELSAVGPKPKSRTDFYPVFGPATTTAGRPALNCVRKEGLR